MPDQPPPREADQQQRPDQQQRAAQLVELERAKLGHCIHDDLLPLIFAARGSVDRVASELAGSDSEHGQRLKQAGQWLEQAMQQCRSLLAESSPPESRSPLWVEAAEQTAAQLLPEQSIRVQWQVDESARELSQQASTALYRIVVESLRNAARHGGATTAAVTANCEGDQVVVEIRDDGCGFDPAEVAGDRFGIRSMRSRAELVDGSLQINSVPGGPTIVTVKIPR